MRTNDKPANTQPLIQGITFYNRREERNPYRNPKSDKKKVLKFMRGSSLEGTKSTETVKAAILGSTWAKNPSLEALQSGSKIIESYHSSPRHANESQLHHSIHNDSRATSKILPQISPRNTTIRINESSSYRRKNPSVGSEIMQLNISVKSPRDFPDAPLTDPNRLLLSTTDLLDQVSNKVHSIIDHNGIMISNTRRASYKISEFATEYKDLYKNSNPAYELTMPKNSARKKNMISRTNGISHDVSHLVDLNASNRKDVKIFLDQLQKETSDFSFKDCIEQSLNKQLDNDTKDCGKSNTLKNCFSNNLQDIVIRKASNFLTVSGRSSPRHNEIHAALKMDIQHNINTLRTRHKRLFSDDHTPISTSPFTTRNVSQNDIQDQNQGTPRAEGATEITDDAAIFSKNLLESLRSQLPNALKDAPSGRAEVLILSNWLKSNVEQIKNQLKLSLTEKLHRTDEIYSLALNELIRQISCECLERGELFMKLWKNYMALYNGIISDIKRHYEKKDKSCHEELTRMQANLKVRLQCKNKEIEELSKSTADWKAKSQAISVEKMKADMKYKQYDEVVAKLKTKVKTAKKQLDILKKEYQDITYKYNKIRKERNLNEEEFDPEEIIQARLIAMQKKPSFTEEVASNELDLEAEEVESQTLVNADQLNHNTPGFGAFVGKKIEFVDKETEIDHEIFSGLTAENSTQTELILVHPQYDVLFSDMETIEELRKEELLKHEIQEENVRNLEEDLQEVIIEQRISRMNLKRRKETDGSAYLSGDASLDSHELTYTDPTKRRRRRPSGMSQVSAQDRSQIGSETYSSLNDLDNDLGNQSDGSIFEATPENKKRKATREECDEDEESKSATRKPREQNEISLELKPKASRSVDAIRLRSQKPGRITLNIPSVERPKREEVASPIQENMEEYAASPDNTRRRKKQFTFDPAHKIQQRIAEKIRVLDERRSTEKSRNHEGAKFSITQLQSHVKEIFKEDAGQNINTLDGGTLSQKLEENTEKDMDSTSGLGKGKYFENMVLHHVKYIRLMKMLNVEKNKAKELEKKQHVLAQVVNEDEQILDKIKEIVGEIETTSNENLDKGKLLKVVKDLQSRKKTVDAIKESNLAELNEGLEADTFVSRAEARSKTTRQRQQSNRLETRGQSSSKILDDESSEKNKKTESGPNYVRKKVDQRATMFKTNLASAHTATLHHPGVSTHTTAVGPLLGRKRDLSTNYRKPNAIAENVNRLKKMLTKRIKMRDLIPLKKILKSITSFLIDKIAASQENAVIRDQDMATFIYTSFVNTYGAAKFAESKYIKFMASVKMYTTIHRVATFARLCGLTGPSNSWTHDESKQFLSGLEFLSTQKNIGTTISNPDTEKRHYTPFVRAIEYARQFCERKNILAELVTLKKDLEKEKEPDPTGKNRAGQIRIDLFLEYMVNLYKQHKERCTEQLRWVFDACNFLGRKTLGLDEFCVLVKYIEPEKYDLKKLEEVYVLNEEYINSENVGIPLSKFVALAIEHELFSMEKQRRFILAADDDEITKNFDSLKESWNKKKERLEQVLEYNHRAFEHEVVTFWTVALGSFDKEMCENIAQNQLYLLMKYRILILEMNATFAANIPLI